MQSNDSVDQLRTEAARNREALATTVQELRERVGDSATEIKEMISPANIKHEIRDYVRQEGENAVELLQRKVKENPLQVAAVAAAVAYPMLGLLRAIPAPLWLIGGGLFLTSKKGRAVAGTASARISTAAQQGIEQVSDLTDTVRADLQDQYESARHSVQEAGAAVSARVGAMTSKANATAHDVRDSVTHMADEAKASAKTALQGAMNSPAVHSMGQAVGAAENAIGKVARSTPSTTTVVKYVNDNALLIAGIGAVVGAVLAASIPQSDAENKMFGAGSDKVKQKARNLADRGIESATDMVADAAGDVAKAAAREGLDAAGITKRVKGAIDSVQTVAERGMDTALGIEPAAATNNVQTNNERNT